MDCSLRLNIFSVKTFSIPRYRYDIQALELSLKMPQNEFRKHLCVESIVEVNSDDGWRRWKKGTLEKTAQRP